MLISGSFSTFVSKSCFLIRPLPINIRLSFEFLLRSIEKKLPRTHDSFPFHDSPSAFRGCGGSSFLLF